MIPISILDLAAAYRKVKVDLFYSGNPHRFALAEFEIDLEQNLQKIKVALETSDNEFLDNLCHGYWLTPKKIEFDNEHQGKPIFSNPEKEFDVSHVESGELRLIANVPVAFHVITTLWINKIGEKFDRLLSNNSYGNRIRRHKDQTPNLNALGSFKPYLHHYQAWRDNGLKAIRENLKHEKSIVAVTADFVAFYHNISADFIVSDTFLKELGITLSSEEKNFTSLIVEMLSKWAKSTPLGRGLPVGCSISAVIANTALIFFDRCIEKDLVPLYYGRYVDDIIIVLENTNNFSSVSDVWKWISNKVPCIEFQKPGSSPDQIKVCLDIFPESENPQDLHFEEKKTKVFLLEVPSGIAFLDSLEHQIRERASEWRSLPELPGDEKIASMLLSACSKSGEEVDNLRKADSLSIRRAMFAMKLRDFESYCRNLKPDDWKEQRRAFLNTIDKHFANLHSFFDLYRYFPRIIAIAVISGDYDILFSIIQKICAVPDIIRKRKEIFKIASLNCQLDGSSDIQPFEDYIKRGLEESILSISPSNSEIFADLAKKFSKDSPMGWNYEQRLALHETLVNFDLAFHPLRHLFFCPEMNLGYDKDIISKVREYKSAQTLIAENDFAILKELALQTTGRTLKIVPQGWIFPTRPFTMSELYFVYEKSLYEPGTVAEILRIFRGYAKNIQGLPQITGEKYPEIVEVNYSGRKTSLQIALTSWKTEDGSWTASACQKDDPDETRYSRLTHLLNQILRSRRALDYVVFPELSIPPRWFLGLAGKLKISGISLISGVEYVHDRKTGTVSNQVWCSLIHDGLGFRDTIFFQHDKDIPAIHEKEDLERAAGKALKPITPGKTCTIIHHGDFYFGILICSELTDINYRAWLRGSVDAIFVPEWNSDVEMFSSLIEAAAYDVHAYIIQCNNRKFGDTRIRIPAKKHFERDIVKIKGGEDDYFVIGEIDIKRLRQFQSFAISPTGENAAFKPVPAGFSIASYRKILPENRK